MLGLKKKDSNKEIELLATIADFNQEFMKAITPSLMPSSILEDAQISKISMAKNQKSSKNCLILIFIPTKDMLIKNYI